MIGIVIVSHSAKLAEGVVELARAMGGEDVQILAAGGLDLPESTLGTDPILIQNAINQVFSEDGVLVLMDLGSALLSTEMAVDLLPDEKKEKVLLCEAPLVEGAISAAVQARIGSPLEKVAEEARNALASKTEHLAPAGKIADPSIKTSDAAKPMDKKQIELVVKNKLGLHARPAARLVKTAGQFKDATIQIENLTTSQGPANAKSINSIFTLSVLQGHKIRVSASGENADAALLAIASLANENFGDTDEESGNTPSRKTAEIKPDSEADFIGLAVSDGLAMGKIALFQAATIQNIPQDKIDDPVKEWQKLQNSITAVILDIENDLQNAKQKIGKQSSEIFEAHLLILKDQEILSPAQNAIMTHNLNAAAAWNQSIEAMAARYQQTGDDYLRTRVQDILDIGQQVLRKIYGIEAAAFEISEPSILVASDLSPAQTSRLDKSKVLGICTVLGGVTSHTAILARSMGVPAICGLDETVLQTPDGTPAIMDGSSGELFLNPSEELQNNFQQKAAELQADDKKAKAESHLPAITLDRQRIEIAANIGSIKEAQQAVKAGAEEAWAFFVLNFYSCSGIRRHPKRNNIRYIPKLPEL